MKGTALAPAPAVVLAAAFPPACIAAFLDCSRKNPPAAACPGLRYLKAFPAYPGVADPLGLTAVTDLPLTSPPLPPRLGLKVPASPAKIVP